MFSRDQCVVVIPCLNEAVAIGPLVQEVRKFLPQVLVVDDGSRDATSAQAEAAGARVLRHHQTEGKGAALTTGFRAAVDAQFAWALAMDGDGQHAPADIPKFLELAGREHAGMIVGNRMTAAHQVPWLRRQVNRLLTRLISNLAGCPLADSQCGFRLLDLSVWAGLPIASRHFEIESELLVQFARAGQTIRFVPIEVIYKEEQSKIQPIRDTLRWWRWWWLTRQAARCGGRK